MMVTCPKCGFQQPQDQYCAQCGVDMQTYKAAPEALTSRLSKSMSFQITVVTVIIAGLIASIYFTQKENIQKTISKAFESTSQPIETSEETAAPGDVASAPTEAAAQSWVADSDDSAAKESEKTAGARVATNGEVKNLEITYLEVPEQLIQIWSSEGQTLSETGNSRAILISGGSGIDGLKRQEFRPENLGQGDAKNIKANKSIRESFLETVPGFTSKLGFNLDIETGSSQPGTIDLTMDIEMNLPIGMDDSVNSSTISGRYTIPKDSILIIVGLIPRQSVKAEVQNAFNDGPLSILQSAEFLSGATEFAIALRPE